MSLPPATASISAINTRARHQGQVAQLSGLSSQISNVRAQISTGRRVNAPSDDPVAFSRAATLRRAQASEDATNGAIDAASRRLRTADIALGSALTLVQRARELGLQGSNATMAPADRAVLAGELAELLTSLTGLAETRDADGAPVFGGALGSGPAYAPDATGQLVWQGAGRAPRIAAGGALVETGITGPEAFGQNAPPSPERPLGSADLFASMAGLVAALTEPDPDLRTAALAQRLGEIEGHGDRLADAQATIGARGARLDAEQERLATQKLATSSDLSRLEDLDMASGIARLQRLLSVLEAAQASFARTASQSLWDQLR